MSKRDKLTRTQKNWRKFYEKHPNTSIYYQPRRPQYREDYYQPEPSLLGRIWNFIKRLIRKIIIAFIILYILAVIAKALQQEKRIETTETQTQEQTMQTPLQ